MDWNAIFTNVFAQSPLAAIAVVLWWMERKRADSERVRADGLVDHILNMQKSTIKTLDAQSAILDMIKDEVRAK